jgi:hypothetical protein
MEQLSDLLLRLSEDWSRYCTFQSEPLVPWTNNATERSIGTMKMRARTVRGYKSWPGMHSGLLLPASDLLDPFPSYPAPFVFPFFLFRPPPMLRGRHIFLVDSGIRFAR